MEARNGDQRSGASAQPTARSRRETPDRRCPSRNHRDFTLARATAEPLALKQNKGVCAAAKRRPVGSRETGQKGTRRRVSIAPPLGGTRDRVPPASDTVSREGLKPIGRDASRLGSRKPDRQSRTRNVTPIINSPVNSGRQYRVD